MFGLLKPFVGDQEYEPFPLPVKVVVCPAQIARSGPAFEVVGDNSVKPPRLAVPPGVDTETVPEFPAPFTAVIWFEEITLNDAAGTPPTRHRVAES